MYSYLMFNNGTFMEGLEENLKSCQLFFLSLQKNSKEDDARVRMCTELRKYCEHLISVGLYSEVIRFFCLMLAAEDEYRKDIIISLIQDIKTIDEVGFYDLCMEVKKRSEEIIKDGLPILSKDYINKKELDNIIFDCVGSKIYGYTFEINPRKVDKKEIEKYVEHVRDYKEMHLPGALYILFTKLETLGGNDGLCFELLEKYIFPIWKKEIGKDNKFFQRVYPFYSDFIEDLIEKNCFSYFMDSFNGWYQYYENDYKKDLISDKDCRILKDGMELLADKKKFAKDYADIICANYSFIERHYSDEKADKWGSPYALAAYVLYCAGEKRECANLLVNHYHDFKDVNKSSFSVQIILARSILETDNLETANILFGYFMYETDRINRERSSNSWRLWNEKFAKTVQFLENAKEHIKKEGRHTEKMSPNSSWYDLLYSDGKIDNAVREIQNSIENDRPVDRRSYNKMTDVLYAYSCSQGINLLMLGIPRQDDDDKLYGALDWELIREAKKLSRCFEDENRTDRGYRNILQSIRLAEVRSMPKLLMMQHISDLTSDNIKRNAEEIKSIRNSIPDGTDADYEIYKRLSDSVDKWLNKVVDSSADKYEIQTYLFQLQDKFQKRYFVADGKADYFEAFSEYEKEKTIQYLQTSEFVYRAMTHSEKFEEFDYSAVLISLTKAIEFILSSLYSRLDKKEYENMPERVKKLSHPERLDFGDYILLLDACESIESVKKDRNYIKVNKFYEMDHFDYWGGNDYFDFSLLKQIKDLSFSIMKGDEIISVSFIDNLEELPENIKKGFASVDEYNRYLLVKILRYIKDNYRNKVAHKSPVDQTMVEECREILVQTQNLLWMMIAMFKTED